MSKINIVDLANKLGVSTATVSRALNNKEGVGEKTRNKVIEMAKEMGYTPNVIAKTMRKEMNVVVIFPIKDENASHYTDLLWRGYKSGKREVENFNIKFHELYYEGESFDEVDKKYLVKLADLKGQGINIDAVLVYLIGNSFELTDYINDLYDDNVPVIAIHKKKHDLMANFLVTDQAEVIGRLAGEMFGYFKKDFKNVLLIENQKEKFFGEDLTSFGFRAYLRKNHPESNIYSFDQFEEGLDSKVKELLSKGKIDIAFATTARASNYLADKIEIYGLKDEVFFIIAGRNKKSESYLKKDICKCIIDNNPLEEGREAVKILVNILIRNLHPKLEEGHIYKKEIKSKIIFKSNL